MTGVQSLGIVQSKGYNRLGLLCLKTETGLVSKMFYVFKKSDDAGP